MDLFKPCELVDALNTKLAGTLKVVDMTPVVEAKKATVESLASAVLHGKSGVGMLLMDRGEASRQFIHAFARHDYDISICGVVLRRDPADGARTLSAVPLERHHTLPTAVRKICSVVAGTECPVCLESLTAKSGATTLPCAHGIHTACLRKLVDASKERAFVNQSGVSMVPVPCPMCRAPFGVDAKLGFWGRNTCF